MARRRRRNSNDGGGGSSSAFDVLLPLTAVAALGIVGYFVVSKVYPAAQKGGGYIDKIKGTFDFGIDATSDTLKGFTDWAGDVVEGIAEFDRREWARLDEFGESAGNISCKIQQIVNPGLQCR